MNIYLKILLVSLFALLLPVFLVSEGLFGKFSFAVIGFVLFFYYPVFSVAIGVYSGMEFKNRWKVIFIFPILFVLLFYVIFRVGDDIFFYFTAGYLAVSIVTMFVVDSLKKKRK